jgi:hypothetical protein
MHDQQASKSLLSVIRIQFFEFLPKARIERNHKNVAAKRGVHATSRARLQTQDTKKCRPHGICTTGPDVDVHDLFGDISLINLTIGLDKVIDDILWKLKQPLGDIGYLTIREDKQRAKALIYVLYDRRRDDVLNRQAFRDYVLGSRAPFYLLAPGAKEEVIKRETSAIAAPQGSPYLDTSSLSTTTRVPNVTALVPDIGGRVEAATRANQGTDICHVNEPF